MKTVNFININTRNELKIDMKSSGIAYGYNNLNYILKVPINLNNKIRKKIKSIIQNKLNNKYIAIHIRRTDHFQNLNKIPNLAKNIIHDREYNIFIKDNPDYKCYIATDCPNTQKKFKNLHKDKIVFYEEISKSKDLRKTSFENAIIDLYICICSNKFKGSFYSSYSKFINLNREKIDINKCPRHNLTKFT